MISWFPIIEWVANKNEKNVGTGEKGRERPDDGKCTGKQ